MSTIIIILIIVFIIVITLKTIEKNILKNQLLISKDSEKISTAYFDTVVQNYIAKPNFFSQSEFMFFKILEEENTQKHLLFANVRFEDLVKRKNKTIKGRGYVKSRHIDFVIVNRQTGNVLALIEVDGKSHNGDKQKKLDEVKNQIAQAAYADKFYRIKVGTDFRAQIKSIFSNI